MHFYKIKYPFTYDLRLKVITVWIINPTIDVQITHHLN